MFSLLAALGTRLHPEFSRLISSTETKKHEKLAQFLYLSPFLFASDMCLGGLLCSRRDFRRRTINGIQLVNYRRVDVTDLVRLQFSLNFRLF